MAIASMFGTDPELFLVDGRGRPVPAHRILPSKADSRPSDHPAGFKLYRDGWAAEINVPPFQCRETLAWAVSSALRRLEHLAAQHGLRIRTSPAVRIDLREMRQPDVPDDVLLFGCEPSLDAYSRESKLVPLNAMTHPWRYAGGHLHLGWDKAAKPSWFPERAHQFIKWCDLFIGLPLTIWFHRPAQYRRRRYYGQAGEFRLQKYDDRHVGVEYRTPGPEIFNHPAVASLALGLMRHLATSLEEGGLKAWDRGIEDDLRGAINEGHLPTAQRLLTDLAGWYDRDAVLKIAEHRPRFFPLDRPARWFIQQRPTRGHGYNRIGWQTFCRLASASLS